MSEQKKHGNGEAAEQEDSEMKPEEQDQIREKLEAKEFDRKMQIVEALIQKPSLKQLSGSQNAKTVTGNHPNKMSRPDFGSLKDLYNKPNSSLQKVKDFLPEFIKETKEIMNDESFRKKKQMDIKITQGQQNNQSAFPTNSKEKDSYQDQNIEMNIGIGVYDILNANEIDPELLSSSKIDSLLPKSTEQIIQIQNSSSLLESSLKQQQQQMDDDPMNSNKIKIGKQMIGNGNNDDSSSSSSNNSSDNGYLEFNSDEDEAEMIKKIQKKLAGSKLTGSKRKRGEIDDNFNIKDGQALKRPFIEDITDQIKKD